MAGEPRAHEGSYVFTHPVDVSGGSRSLFADRPLATRSPGFQLALALEMKIEGHSLADETLQRCFVDLLAFVNIDGRRASRPRPRPGNADKHRAMDRPRRERGRRPRRNTCERRA